MPIKIQYYLIGLLVIGTATVTTHYFELGMMGLTAFAIAYLSKGMRRN
ncbi:MAG: hypothetical protein ACRDEA_05600 [Microcystaceae cyanobacterium]